MKFTATSLIFLALLLGNATGCKSAIISNTEVLGATIAGLNLVNPGSDARENAARGDLRLIGLTDYACHPPGREGIELQPIAELYGLRCLKGTSDVIESKEHADLTRQAWNYGIQYNKVIVEIIREREGSNNSFKPTPLRGAA